MAVKIHSKHHSWALNEDADGGKITCTVVLDTFETRGGYVRGTSN